MQSEQFELHAEIEQRHWWFVARRRDSFIRHRGGAASIAQDHDRRRRLWHRGQPGGAGRTLSLRRHRHFAARPCDWPRGDFPRSASSAGMPRTCPATIASARLVLLTDVLEHVRDDFQLLSELLSLAQPGTYFLLTVPADPSLWSQHDQAFGHYRRYELERFEADLAGAGGDAPVRFALQCPAVSDGQGRAWLEPSARSLRRPCRHRLRAASAACNYLLTRIFAGERRRLRGWPGAHRRRRIALASV